MCTSGVNTLQNSTHLPRYHAPKSLALHLATKRFVCNISDLIDTFLPQTLHTLNIMGSLKKYPKHFYILPPRTSSAGLQDKRAQRRTAFWAFQHCYSYILKRSKTFLCHRSVFKVTFVLFSVCVPPSLQYHNPKIRRNSRQLHCLVCASSAPDCYVCDVTTRMLKNKTETLMTVFRWKPISD